MSKHRACRTWFIGAAFALIAGSAMAGGDTPTWADALEASPNRATPAEEAELQARAASGESALQAPAGVYAPSAAEPSASDATARSADATVPTGAADRDQASASGTQDREPSSR